MFKKIFDLVFVSFLLLQCSIQGAVKWILETELEFKTDLMKLIDIDDDNVDEVMMKEFCTYLIRDQKGTIIKEKLFDDDNYFFIDAVDLDNSAPKDLIFQKVYKDTLYLSIFENDKKEYRVKLFSVKDINPPEGWQGGCGEVSAADLNKDGFSELICFVRTGYDVQPRGVFVYDYHNKRELWHFLVGGNPYFGSCFCPFLNDNIHSKDNWVIFGTAAHCNGGLANGVDDSSSYVVVLDSKGKLVWKKKVGDKSTTAVPCCVDVDKDGEVEVVVIEEAGLADNKKPNSLLILDGETGEIEHYINIGEKFFGMKVCDYNRDGRLEIITGNTDGKIRVFDDFLNPIQESSFTTSVKVLSVCDFDGDGTNEILLSTRSSKLFILNEQLETVLDEKIMPEANFVHANIVNCGRRKKLLFKVRSDNISSYKLMSIAPVLPLGAQKPYNIILIVVSILVFSGVILGISYFVHTTKRIRNIRRTANILPYAFIMFDPKQRITYMNNLAKNMFQMEGETLTDKQVDVLVQDIDRERFHNFLKSEKKEQIFRFTSKGEQMERNFEARLYPFNSEHIIIVEDITSRYLSDKIVSWAGFAQKLAHEVKNPLSTITLTLQRLQSLYRKELGKGAGKLDAYTDSILEEVDRLRGTTDRFMRILSIEKPVFKLNDMNSLIEAASKKYENVLPEGVRIKKSYGKDIPSVRCDSSQIMVLVNNLIENGLEAIAGSGALSIRSLLVEKVIDGKIGKYIEVSVEDNGVGIAGKDLRNLYKSFYTTKQGGTGLGLLISRQIVELHNGEISIQSKKGIGTTVMVRLPIEQLKSDAQKEDEA